MSAEAHLSVSGHVNTILPSIVQVKAQKSDSNGDETEFIESDSGGTGFVLEAPNRILTNAHIVGDAKKIVVVDQTRSEYPAILVGKDDATDIAVLEVAGLALPPLTSGNSVSLKVGDTVFLAGYPFSLGHSVSLGIISGKDRFLPNYPYIRFIQTDAAVNPGNSGGPIFNGYGELIGMVSTYFSRNGGYTNIAFAIPVNDVRRIAEILARDHKVQRGYLGADLLISDKLVRKMGHKSGVFVTRVDADSPAAKADIRAGDLIIGSNDQKLDDSGRLHRLLEQMRPDENLTLTLQRDDNTVVAMVRLGDPTAIKEPLINIGSGDDAEKMGLILQEKGQELEVAISYGMAKKMGFISKDVILRVNNTSVKTIKELNAQLDQLKQNDMALIQIQRNGTQRLTLPLGSKTAIKGYSTHQ